MEAEGRKHKNKWSEYRFVAVIVLVILLAYICSRNWYQLMLIQGQSMIPAYHNLQFVIIDKHTNSYERGDVVAVKVAGIKGVIVKRIVAMPKDRAQIIDGTLYINGEMSEPYRNTTFAYAGLFAKEIQLDEGEYLMIGDNTKESKDSRYEEIGVIEQVQITGEVFPKIPYKQ